MERYYRITGECEDVYKKIDEFFEKVKNEIGIKKDRPSEFEIRLCCPIGKTAEYEIVTLEDKLHMLLYREKVVAVVTETRNSFNYVQFDFFKNLEDLENR